MNVLTLHVSSSTIYCMNALLFHVSSFTIYYMNALVIKANNPLYSRANACCKHLFYISQLVAVEKKNKVFDYRVTIKCTVEVWLNKQATLGAVRKLRKHIGVLSWSEKGNFCLFLVLKRVTQLVKNSKTCLRNLRTAPQGTSINDVRFQGRQGGSK